MSAKPSAKKPAVRKRKEADLPTPGAFSEHQRCTRDDLRILHLHYPTKGSQWVARKLGRTINSVQAKAGTIGLKYQGHKSWTEKELRYLCRNFHKHEIDDIARELNRTKGSVAGRLVKLRAEMKQDPEYPFKLQLKSRHRAWTEKQLNFIRASYGTLTPSEIAKRLGVDARRVGRKAYSLGLTSNAAARTRSSKTGERLSREQKQYIFLNMAELDPVEIARHLSLPHSRVLKFLRYHGESSTDGARRLWTSKEIAFLRKNFSTMLIKDIARTIGRTPGATMRKAKQLRLSLDDGFYVRTTKWTDEEERLLRELYPVTTLREIAVRLERKRGTVWEYAKRMGLVREGNNYYMQKHVWTEEEETLLRTLYLTHTAREIGELLGRTRHSVIGHVQKLGLTRKKKK